MNDPISIAVHQLYRSAFLHTREQAQQLFEQITNTFTRRNDPVYIDFSDISFISRSFADELVHLRSMARQKDQIVFCCTNSDIEQMFRAVENTQKGRSLRSNIPVHKFSNTESLLRYFSEQ